MRCSRRTILEILYTVPPKQSFGSSTGQAERATVERSFATDHLHDAISLGNKRWIEKTDVSICLFHVILDEEQLRPPRSARVKPASREKAYLNRVEYYPLTPHGLMGRQKFT